MVDTQLVALLTEYSQNPSRTLEEVAMKVQLSLAHARRLMKKFAYAMAATQTTDPEYPSLAAEKLGIPQQVAFALEGHVENYADKSILNELKRSGIGPGARGIATDSYQMMHPPQQEYISSASLNGSNPYKILTWLLTSIFRKDIDPVKAEGFLRLFEVREAEFMANPMDLQATLENRFGLKVGRQVFNEFYNMVATRLGPGMQFGAPAWGGPPGMMGGPTMMGNGGGGGAANQYGPSRMSAMNYWQSKGIIPTGVDPTDPEAIAAIDRYKRQEEMKLQDDEIQMKLKSLLNMRMVEMVDKNNMAGGGMGGNIPGPMGAGAAAIGPYVASGQVRMIVRQGANGQPETVWENTALGPNGLHGTNDPNQFGLAEMMSRFYTQMLEMQKANTGLFQPFMEKIVNRGLGFEQQQNPIQMFRDMKEVFTEMNPGAGRFNDSLEAAKLLIADKRVEADREVALKQIEQKRSDTAIDKEWEHKQELASGQRMDSFLENVVGKGIQQFGPVIGELLAKKFMGGGAGGPGGPPNMPQGPIPSMDGGFVDQGPPSNQGPPMRRMPGTMVGREDVERYQAAYGAGGGGGFPSMTEGQRAAMIAEQQERDARDRLDQQANAQRNAWASVAQARTYTPDDFRDLSPEQLETVKMQGRAWMESAENFRSAITQLEAGRARQASQGPTTFAQPQGVTATGPRFTEVSQSAVDAAQAAATSYDPNYHTPLADVPMRDRTPEQQRQEQREEEPSIDLDDITPAEQTETDDEISAREDETGNYEDTGVVDYRQTEDSEAGDVV